MAYSVTIPRKIVNDYGLLIYAKPKDIYDRFVTFKFKTRIKQIQFICELANLMAARANGDIVYLDYK